jgi:SAM-dependent methyltransferase
LRGLLPFGLKSPVLKQHNVVGGPYRLNTLCPVCGSYDRERLLYLYLLKKTKVFCSPLKLLHIAPEKIVENILRDYKNLDYLTADLYEEDVMVKMDITDIQFPDDTFDAIICNHVLEHIVDDLKAMSELHRILKPGGWAILQVPISLSLKETYEDFSITTPECRERAFGLADHVRIYAKDYRQRLEQVGFSVDIFRWTEEPDLFGGRHNRFRLHTDEELYVAIKQQ